MACNLDLYFLYTLAIFVYLHVVAFFFGWSLGVIGYAYDSSTGFVGYNLFSSTGVVVQSKSGNLFNNITGENILYGRSWNAATKTYLDGFTCDLYRSVKSSGMPCDLNSMGYHVGDSFLILVQKRDIHKCLLPSDLEVNFIVGVTGICLFLVTAIFIVIRIVIWNYYYGNCLNSCFSYYFHRRGPIRQNNNYRYYNPNHMQSVPSASVLPVLEIDY